MQVNLRTTALGQALRVALPVSMALLVLAAWNPRGNFWLTVEAPKAQCEAYDAARLREAKVATYEIYAPEKLDRLIREPQNTLSNLAYAAAGLALILASKQPASRSLGIAGIFLGLGSGLYHATLLPEWRMVDILGVYAVLYGLIWVGLSHHFRFLQTGWRAWWGCGLIWSVALYTGVHRNEVRWHGIKVFDSTYVFVAAVALGSLLAILACARMPARRAAAGRLGLLAACAGVSFAGGIGDRLGGFWAAPEALVQGHAVWHVCGALALLAAYEVFAVAGFDRSVLAPRTPTAPVFPPRG